VSALLYEPYARHPDLHSFPTRRSSDLCDRRAVSRTAPHAHRASVSARSCRLEPPRADGAVRGRANRHDRHAACCPSAALGARARSEEHTSELQSLAYLVCRLLLEKKTN